METMAVNPIAAVGGTSEAATFGTHPTDREDSHVQHYELQQD